MKERGLGGDKDGARNSTCVVCGGGGVYGVRVWMGLHAVEWVECVWQNMMCTYEETNNISPSSHPHATQQYTSTIHITIHIQLNTSTESPLVYEQDPHSQHTCCLQMSLMYP